MYIYLYYMCIYIYIICNIYIYKCILYMYVFYIYIYIMYNLVGGFNHLETYELVNGKGDIPYMKWKIKAMFQTTNQYIYIYMLGL